MPNVIYRARLLAVVGCALSLQTVALPSARGAVTAPTGAVKAGATAGTVVEGTVRAHGAVPKPTSITITKDVPSCGTEYQGEPVASPDGGLANVVVSLRGAAKPPAVTAPPRPATLDQVGCRYTPHVQTANVGSELTLVNSDRVLHNVHGYIGPVTVFNVAMPIKGQRLPTKLSRPGLIRLQCDAGHSWMNAWVHVFDHPYHAVTDERGRFEIADVPPGTYTVEYWREPSDGKGAGTVTTNKLVVGGKRTRADGAFKF